MALRVCVHVNVRAFLFHFLRCVLASRLNDFHSKQRTPKLEDVNERSPESNVRVVGCAPPLLADVPQLNVHDHVYTSGLVQI